MERVEVVVIGGGIIGASVTYHLAKRGWRDCVLLEKSILTAGSTWHAAANGNSINALPNLARLQRRSIEIYREIEEEAEQSLGIHRPGGVFLATNADRLAEYRTLVSRGLRLRFGWRIASPEEIAEMHPLTDVTGVLGGLYSEDDGHIDPSGATHAFAKAARARGARVRQNCAVRALRQTADGGWIVSTDDVEYEARAIVNAAGLWADEIAAMTGARLPMTRMEHHYLVTEAIPEIASLSRELPLIRDGDSSFYMRQEQQSLLLGVYERDATPWALDGVPPSFGQELLPDAVERLMPNLEQAFTRFPVLARTGIKRAVNGPFVFSPDGNPLIGPMPGQKNHFCAAAFLAGLNMGGGFGELIAEWMTTGRTALDVSSCDVARFGEWAPGAYATARAKDVYAHRYQLHYPFEEREAGRPVRAFPALERHRALGAVFGPVNGWERPLWYARPMDESRDVYGFGRQNWFEAVSEEARAVRAGVGLMDASAFAKYLVTGPAAGAWLSRMVANTLPGRDGRTRLVHMCDDVGGIVAEFTATRLAADRWLLVGASAFERIHLRWMHDHPMEGAHVAAITGEKAVVAVQGPRARELLATLTTADLGTEAFPYMSAGEIEVAGRICLAIRVSFVGELGWELYCAPGDVVALWDALHEAGQNFGVRPFGARALDWLRLEKGYPRFGSELNTEVTPFEAGLGWAVKLDKGDFIGRAALVAHAAEDRSRYRLRLLAVEPGPSDPVGRETILTEDGAIAGYVTSGGYGPHAGASLALALLYPGYDDGSARLLVDQQGTACAARILDAAPVDPAGTRLRS